MIIEGIVAGVVILASGVIAPLTYCRVGDWAEQNCDGRLDRWTLVNLYALVDALVFAVTMAIVVGHAPA